MQRALILALLALPLLAGATGARAGEVGDYHFRDTRKPHGHKRSLAQLRADDRVCMARTGYRDDVSQLYAMMHDPAYLGCMTRHGWQYYAYTPPRHRYHGGSGRPSVPDSSVPDTSDNGAIQAGVDASNANNAAVAAQNAAAQALAAEAAAATQLLMNQQQ